MDKIEVGLAFETKTTIVESQTIVWFVEASLLSSAPSLSGTVASAVSATIIVRRTISRNGNALTSGGTDAESLLDSTAGTTASRSLATSRSLNTGLLGSTPAPAKRTDTLASLTVVIQRTGQGNEVARISQSTPASSSLVLITITPLIRVQTAFGNANAFFKNWIPDLA